MTLDKHAAGPELAKLVRYIPVLLTLLFELRQMVRRLREEQKH